MDAPGFRWIREHWNELPEGEWAAVGNEGVRERAESFESLLAAMERDNVNTETVTIVLRRDGKPVNEGSNLSR